MLRSKSLKLGLELGMIGPIEDLVLLFGGLLVESSLVGGFRGLTADSELYLAGRCVLFGVSGIVFVFVLVFLMEMCSGSSIRVECNIFLFSVSGVSPALDSVSASLSLPEGWMSGFLLGL